MATEDKKAPKMSKSNKAPSQEQIVSGFNQLRQDQRALASKLSELEMELTEHGLVIDTLKDVDGDRKCYRMIGGILAERTVKDVLPVLIKNKEQIGKAIEAYTQKVSSKGEEINQYREKYNIRIRGQDDIPGISAQSGDASALDNKQETDSEKTASAGDASKSAQGILVSEKS